MIKAYFFDLMNTLCWYDGDIVSDLCTDKERTALLTGKFEDANISETYKERVHSRLANTNFQLYEDSEKIINKLTNANYKLALVSDAYDITAQRVRNLFSNLFDKFDILTFSSEIGVRKPNPKMFSNTLDRLNEQIENKILPEEVVMIGDKYEKDILPAERLGMQARIIDRNKQSLEDVI